MKLKELMLKGQKGDEILMIVFLVIAVALGIVGYIRETSVWYIRTGIFCAGALFLFWRKNC